MECVGVSLSCDADVAGVILAAYVESAQIELPVRGLLAVSASGEGAEGSANVVFELVLGAETFIEGVNAG